VSVSGRLEVGWQRRLTKARLEDAADLLADLELDPTLPARGQYAGKLQSAQMSEEEFAGIYLEGVRLAFASDALSFFEFMDIVFAHVNWVVDIAVAEAKAWKEAADGEKEEVVV
jgi:hypothetical protein